MGFTELSMCIGALGLFCDSSSTRIDSFVGLASVGLIFTLFFLLIGLFDAALFTNNFFGVRICEKSTNIDSQMYSYVMKILIEVNSLYQLLLLIGLGAVARLNVLCECSSKGNA